MAIHKDPFQNAPFVFKLNGVDRAVQVTKFGEVLICPKLPNAIHNPFPYATNVAMVNGTVTVHEIPSVEYIIPAWTAATQVPFV